MVLAVLLGVVAIPASPAWAAASAASCDAADAIAHALPAVVNILVVRVLPAKKAAQGKPPDEHFEIFVGSGVIIDPSGIIVTNKHVIQDAAVIKVTLQDKSQYSAQLVDAAGLVDLAVLKVAAPAPLPTLSFANSDAVQVGQPVIAVGNPLGIGTSVSTGVVSALDRDLMRTPFDDFIQTDASINPGNSGGPLLNCDGKVIGIDTALLSNNSLLGSIGLGFAMPSNDVSFVTDMLRNPGQHTPNWVGLHLQDLTAQLATIFKRPSVEGAIVTGVDPDSPAAGASLAPGDIITGALGHDLPDARAILRAIVMTSSGEPISLSVWQHGQMKDVVVRGQPWPHMMALRNDVLASRENIARAEESGVGLHVSAITAADRKRYDLSPQISGVLIDHVKPGSEAADMDLHAGDVIQQVEEETAKTPEQVMARLMLNPEKHGGLVALLVQQKGGPRWSSLWIGRIDPDDLLVERTQPQAGSQSHDVASRPR